MSKAPMKKVWLVKHPISQYNEDVKDLAATNRLKIIDAKFSDLIGAEFRAENPPTLTEKKAKTTKRRSAPAAPAE